MHVDEQVEGILLAGGSSRRMGRDKAWLEIRGRPVIAGLLDTLRRSFGGLRVVAKDPSFFPSLGVPIQRDLRPGAGPLSGIHAALATTTHPIICVVACDLPFVTSTFLTGLGRRLQHHEAVAPRPRGRPVATCAYYRVSCLAAAEACLEESRFRAAGLLERVDVRWVDDTELEGLDPSGVALFNVNTPEDYELAKRLAE